MEYTYYCFLVRKWTLVSFLNQEEGFLDWINPIYLSPEIQADIRERFENESEIELSEFIKVGDVQL